MINFVVLKRNICNVFCSDKITIAITFLFYFNIIYESTRNYNIYFITFCRQFSLKILHNYPK